MNYNEMLDRAYARLAIIKKREKKIKLKYIKNRSAELEKKMSNESCLNINIEMIDLKINDLKISIEY
ncbi:MAG: hypothetical protein P1P85_00175 [Patescibacteria group bacterium]|nr:hypothetical protein [Patescibacteria group bacterium]